MAERYYLQFRLVHLNWLFCLGYKSFLIDHSRRSLLPQVLEVRPVIDWNKGKAVEFLLESLGEWSFIFCIISPSHSEYNCNWSSHLFMSLQGFVNSDDVLPIYIGDDRTDEDAFKVRTYWFKPLYCLHVEFLS